MDLAFLNLADFREQRDGITRIGERAFEPTSREVDHSPATNR